MMKRTYAAELELLPSTYQYCLSQDVTALSKWCYSRRNFPLFSVGSGGSYTAAVFASELHNWSTSEWTWPLTPLQFTSSNATSIGTVLFLSASGANSDILFAVREAIARSRLSVGVLCGAIDTPLAQVYGHRCELHEFGLPTGKDRFLATNSLLATSVFLARAYELVSPSPLPSSFSAFSATVNGVERHVTECWSEQLEPLARADTIVILHGAEVRAAATDLESKLTEGGVKHAQLADLRQFAHGRHYWLASHPHSTAVIIFSTERDRTLAESTAATLPSQTPCVRLEFERGPAGGVAAIIAAMQFIQDVIRDRGVDPANPGVPEFGRQLYHVVRPTVMEAPTALADAIARKSRSTFRHLRMRGELASWERALNAFLHRLSSSQVGCIVLDYDGTICDSRWRSDGPPAEAMAPLVRILEAGVPIGIATGRGKSIHRHLRERIPAEFWDKVSVGYYNGWVISPLSKSPPTFEALERDRTLHGISEWLNDRPDLYRGGKMTVRGYQITIEFPDESSLVQSLEAIEPFLYVRHEAGGGARVLRSRHSIDILAQGVSKLNVVSSVKDVTGNRERECLCIGDMGDFPGNDFELLAQSVSLSVDQVSSDPNTCWNLAPAGCSNFAATLMYLESFDIRERVLHWNQDSFQDRADSYDETQR